MEARHEMTAHIRKMRPIFYQVGLLVGLLVTLGAFRWTTKGETVALDSPIEQDWLDSTMGEVKIEEEMQKQDELKKTTQKLEIPKPSDPKIVDDKTEITPDSVATEYNPLANWDDILRSMPKLPKGPTEFTNNDPIDVASEMPSFPGGDEALQKYFAKNYMVPPSVTEYPTSSSLSLRVKCVVEKDGSISNVVIVKDGGSPEAADAFVKTVQKMPRWNPGYQGAHAVRVYVTIPLKIRLR